MTGLGRRAARAVLRRITHSRVLFAAACAFALAGCNQHDSAKLSAAQPRGATVAFESIDGPPNRHFERLVHSLNEEAQVRRLAVISRDQTSAYRVRGYLAANVVRDLTTISWVWDVFDRDEHRVLRISGEETAKAEARDAWSVADDAMLQRIARSSMDQIASFTTSPEVAPGGPAAEAVQIASATPADASPEAAGIFRIPQADPIDAARDGQGAGTTLAGAHGDAVPMPRPRPETALSALGMLTVAAARP